MPEAQLRLLMIEDSEDDAELIRLELEKAGYRLEWRRLDHETEFVRALVEPWDLIICDFQMPQFDGLRAFNLYKQREIDTPFIFVSGALGEERAVAAMRAGARDYLLKDNLARLSAAVERELREARNRRAQKLAEEAARREQRRLAMAVEASGAGIFEFKLPPFPETYQSERWNQILGLSTEDAPLSQQFADWYLEQVHPDDLSAVRRCFDDFIDGQTAQFDCEFRIRHRRGIWVDVLTIARAVTRSPEGRPTHVVGVMLDLSERRKLEAQLRQAQKMEAVGRLAGGVAHDFNNLLLAIFGFGTFVLEALEPGSPPYQDMEELLQAARRAEQLTGQLLAFSRHKPVLPKVANVNRLLADMSRMLQRIVGEDVEIVIRQSPDLRNTFIDAGSFEQVIVNMAVNARDAMPGGGKLVIASRNLEVAPEYAVELAVEVPPGEYVVVSLSDTGSGMDEITKARIFEPFFTTKAPGRGTGLGLSTCYGIVKQAGGYILLHSEPGRGTTFEILLPVVSGEVVEATEARVPSERLQGSETILVAEDDDRVRALIARVLSSFGYRVIPASSGGDALRILQGGVRDIDLLVTDLVMPELNGEALAEQTKQLVPHAKVLYISGHTGHAWASYGVPEGEVHLLRKPFTPEALAKAVRAVLEAETGPSGEGA